MADREKVIRGLQCCQDGICALDDCPYFNMTYCTTSLHQDTLELLKEQEPQVLTREELPDLDGAFLVEVRNGKNKMVWASYYAEYELGGDTVIRMIDIDGGVDDRLKNLYGYEWRCWTARPTDEQREATPWIS